MAQKEGCPPERGMFDGLTGEEALAAVECAREEACWRTTGMCGPAGRAARALGDFYAQMLVETPEGRALLGRLLKQRPISRMGECERHVVLGRVAGILGGMRADAAMAEFSGGEFFAAIERDFDEAAVSSEIWNER